MKNKNETPLFSSGLPVRSQLKAGFEPDKCKICHLGCLFLDGKKKEICDEACDTNSAKCPS